MDHTIENAAPVAINDLIDAAIDGKDWPAAALALLAHPYSVQLGRTFSVPLVDVIRGEEVEDCAWIVTFRADQIAFIDREAAGHDA